MLTIKMNGFKPYNSRIPYMSVMHSYRSANQQKETTYHDNKKLENQHLKLMRIVLCKQNNRLTSCYSKYANEWKGREDNDLTLSLKRGFGTLSWHSGLIG